MLPYYNFFIIEIGLLVFLALTRRQIIQNLLVFVFISILVLFAGLRGLVGIDTSSYHLIFKSINLNPDSISEWFVFEPLFSIYMILIRFFSDDAYIFTFIIAFTQGVIIFLITRKHPNKVIFLTLYISAFYIQNQFNIIRAGLAGLLLIYVYAQKTEGKDYSLPLIFSILCHYSALIALPFLIDKKYKFRLLALLVVSTIAFVAIGGVERVSDKLMHYFVDSIFFSEGTIQINLFFIVIVCLILIAHVLANKKHGYQMHFLVGFVILLKILEMRFPALWRVHDLIYFLWLSITSYSIGSNIFSKKSIPILLICMCNLYALYNNMLNEDKLLLDRAQDTGELSSSIVESPLIPYRTLFDEH